MRWFLYHVLCPTLIPTFSDPRKCAVLDWWIILFWQQTKNLSIFIANNCTYSLCTGTKSARWNHLLYITWAINWYWSYKWKQYAIMPILWATCSVNHTFPLHYVSVQISHIINKMIIIFASGWYFLILLFVNCGAHTMPMVRHHTAYISLLIRNQSDPSHGQVNWWSVKKKSNHMEAKMAKTNQILKGKSTAINTEKWEWGKKCIKVAS